MDLMIRSDFRCIQSDPGSDSSRPAPKLGINDSDSIAPLNCGSGKDVPSGGKVGLKMVMSSNPSRWIAQIRHATAAISSVLSLVIIGSDELHRQQFIQRLRQPEVPAEPHSLQERCMQHLTKGPGVV